MDFIIIEDEKPAARYLSRMLSKMEGEPRAVLNSVKESIAWFAENPEPELIFLDIQLGDGSSFEIFEQIQPKSAIIFTTAFDKYAIKAFKLNSIDYLLKPIQESELKQALEKFKSHVSRHSWDVIQLKSLLEHNFENKYRERFLVRIGSNLKTMEVENIACFYSKNKSTYLFVNHRQYPIESTLTELVNQLNPKDFFRISRNSIVNLRHIDSITSYMGNRYELKIKGVDEELIVSRERVIDFKAWLEN